MMPTKKILEELREMIVLLGFSVHWRTLGTRCIFGLFVFRILDTHLSAEQVLLILSVVLTDNPQS